MWQKGEDTMRRNLKTPYGAFEVEEAYYNNNGILYAKVVVEYDQNGTPRHPIPYDVNIGECSEGGIICRGFPPLTVPPPKATSLGGFSFEQHPTISSFC